MHIKRGKTESGTSELLGLGNVTEINETAGTMQRWKRERGSQTLVELSVTFFLFATSRKASAGYFYKVVYIARIDPCASL